MIVFHFLSLDGLNGNLAALIFGDSSTKYSKGYSDKKFREVKIEMTKKEVNAILGAPISNRVDCLRNDNKTWNVTEISNIEKIKKIDGYPVFQILEESKIKQLVGFKMFVRQIWLYTNLEKNTRVRHIDFIKGHVFEIRTGYNYD